MLLIASAAVLLILLRPIPARTPVLSKMRESDTSSEPGSIATPSFLQAPLQASGPTLPQAPDLGYTPQGSTRGVNIAPAPAPTYSDGGAVGGGGYVGTTTLRLV